MSVSKWMLSIVIASASVRAVAADNYTINLNHTYPSFEFSHMGLSVWRGKFNKTSGKITTDRAAKTGTVDVAVDPVSINFELDKMDEKARSEDFFNVAKFHTATYKGRLKFIGHPKDGRRRDHARGGRHAPGEAHHQQLQMHAPSHVQERGVRRRCGRRSQLVGLRNEDEQDGEGEMGKVYLRIQVEALKDG